jgi:hypothetical protein
MWIPKSEGEILAAIEAGDLIETATFDAKASLPAKGKSRDLAIDVAAMANDGGSLLYGIGEDEYRRPTVPTAFDLAGARERIDQIVRTCISEAPDIQVREIQTDNDPSLGYLVVAVPPSPRAPHMVTVGKEYRYYGRSDTGNVPLIEGEVARLYERRRVWEIDREKLLDEVIEKAPIETTPDYAYLHLVAHPVVPDEDLFDRAKGDRHVADFVNGLFSIALSSDVWPRTYGGKGYSPDLSDNNHFDRSADGWVTSRGLGADGSNFVDPGRVLQVIVGLDGTGHLFCGRAAERTERGNLLLFEDLVAGLTARFLSVLGGLYAAGAYLGPVDLGLAVTRIREAMSHKLSQNVLTMYSLQPYDRDTYRRTERCWASTLKEEPRSAARKLALPLMRAITQEGYDPFSD